ncbi:hypothetical protein QFZ43_004097 [Streptomyces afghaniensis]|nr:hypothetical protein [Streptomyces afghaniensis]
MGTTGRSCLWSADMSSGEIGETEDRIRGLLADLDVDPST